MTYMYNELHYWSSISTYGICQVKQIQKSEKNSEVGGLSPNSDFYFFENVAFFVCFCVVFMFPNVSKQNQMQGVGGCMGSDQSEFFLNFWMFF